MAAADHPDDEFLGYSDEDDDWVWFDDETDGEDNVQQVGVNVNGAVSVQLDLNSPPPQDSPQPENTTPPTPQSSQHNQTIHVNHTSRMSNEKRLEVLFFLLDRQKTGSLKYGAITEAATHFGFTIRTIGSLWNKAKKQKQAMQAYNVDNNCHSCGRKRIQVTYEAISQIPMGNRTCIRDLAVMLGVGQTTVWRLIKRKIIKPHSSSLHPGISESCKMARLKWVLGLIMCRTIPHEPTYYTMFDFVHIDEKWFYLTQKNQRVYLANNEPKPYRSSKSRQNIPKFMFMGAVARPRWNSNGQNTFSGKIGIFPFVENVPAKRKSKNRAAGTIEVKQIKSVNQEATRSMLINKVIPAIKAKWPNQRGEKVIYLIQDNAKTHIKQDDPEWQKHFKQDGFTFILTQQPPNSPDCNILDLGFFRVIQSLMHKKMPQDVNSLCDAVHEAFDELHPKTLSNVWMTLQFVMNEILKHKGGNDYQLPHNKKKILEDEGRLPEQVKAPRWVVEECMRIYEEYAARHST